MVISILMHYQHFPFKKTLKMYFVALIRPAAASFIKPLACCIYSLVNQWKATLRNDVGFPTLYRRIYCRKFMTLSNQTSRCICKCIRIRGLLYSKFSFGEVYRRIYGNLVLRRRVSGPVKRGFRTYIRRYTSPNENFEYGYPHSNALLTLSLQKYSENVLCCAYTPSSCQLHKTACQLHIFTCQPMKSDVTQ